MEHTKGEMIAGRINCGQFPVSIDGRHFAIIKFTHLIDMKQDEANAKEFVRRWNAFEKDGLVDELLGCLVELVDIIDGGTMMDTFTTQPAKAAIAKAKA